MNRLFWKALSQNTTTDFELILIDNHSTDGSQDYFHQLSQTDRRVRYFPNPYNQNYPTSQIQGMREAKHNTFCFLNNDVWMPKGWELPLLKALEYSPYLIASPTGQEVQPVQKASDRLKRKWKFYTQLSFVWKRFFAIPEERRLWQSLKWMYGNLDSFRHPGLQGASFPAIKGDCLFFRKELLEKIPQPWNPQVEAADWHLYLLAAQMHEKDSSFPLPQAYPESYVHHFGRYSARQEYEPFKTSCVPLKLEEVWTPLQIREWWWGYC